MTEPKRVPSQHLDQATAMDLLIRAEEPGGFERALLDRERAAQTDLVESIQLPVEGSPGHSKFGKTPDVEDAVWAAMGIEFGPVRAGELFRDAKLPVGWSKRATDHSMWSNLVDDRGRVRARIFYKGAIYDRSASMTLCRRFTVTRNFDGVREAQNKCEPVPMQVQVFDGATLIWQTELAHVRAYESNGAWWDDCEKLEQEHLRAASEWLEAKYPNFRDPTAHWDEPDHPPLA